jgi:thiol-disulfide isomerase/thioredoxin
VNKKSIYFIVIILAALIFAFLIYSQVINSNSNSGTKNFSGQMQSYINAPVPQSLINELNVPSSVSNKIGIGAVSNPPKKINATPLMGNGLPEILYVGADYCPYCAVTRWGMIIALMRFGTFSNLHYMLSNSSDVYPNTPTFTFYNSTYSSNVIDFVAVETQQNNYKPLQQLTAQQQALFSAYDPSGGIPFIDFGNVSIQLGAPILPSLIDGYAWDPIAANLTNPSSAFSQAIVGTADVYTAEICLATNFTPSSVCSQGYISSILNSLGQKGA